MNITKFQIDFLRELENLKFHAHKDELVNLNPETFDPTLPHGCIYGQLTGECHSIRAKHLLNLCAIPYSDRIDRFVPATEKDFHQRKLFVVGNHDSYSALEFVVHHDIFVRGLVIKYLKSEIFLTDIILGISSLN